MKKVTLYILVMLSVMSNQLLSQVYHPDRHSTNLSDAWLSCAVSQNPNPDQGQSHWIMYDLGKEVSLSELYIWNLNHPDRLSEGIQGLSVEVSSDLQAWDTIDDITIPQSTGSSYYTGEAIIDLSSYAGRYVVLTAQSTYGGSCAGLSEVRLSVSTSSLPVVISAYDARCHDGGKIIRWKMESQTDHSHFLLEKSEDLESWKIVRQLSHGNGESWSEYEVLDAEAAIELVYYRLSQYDVDGTMSDLGIVSAQCDPLYEEPMVYPNPARGSTILYASSDLVSSQGKFTIVDDTGRRISRGNIQGIETPIDLSTVVPGTYHMIVNSQSRNYSLPVVVIQ